MTNIEKGELIENLMPSIIKAMEKDDSPINIVLEEENKNRGIQLIKLRPIRKEDYER